MVTIQNIVLNAKKETPHEKVKSSDSVGIFTMADYHIEQCKLCGNQTSFSEPWY